MEIDVITVTPVNPGPVFTFGVFANEDGSPRFVPVAAWGVVRITSDKGAEKRLAAGFCPEKHPEPADFEADFVGYHHGCPEDGIGNVYPGVADRWRERCVAVREQIKAREEKAKQQKIVVPGKTVLGFNN